jgi:hypothetical protein
MMTTTLPAGDAAPATGGTGGGSDAVVGDVAVAEAAPASDATVTVDGGGAAEAGGPVTPPAKEATWSYTACNKTQLMFPNIDKNMGKFPIGSCPPPEDLPRPCGGNSKIKVMKAESSPWETGFFHPPQYATDEYLMTRWSSNMGPSAWLQLDLGTEQSFKRIYLAWELAHATDYDIVTSNDAMTWTTAKQIKGGDGFQDIVDIEGKGRYIRINGVTRGKVGNGPLYGYSLFDVVICGERP